MLCYIIRIITPSILDTSGSPEPLQIPRFAWDIWQTYAPGWWRGDDMGAGIDSLTEEC